MPDSLGSGELGEGREQVALGTQVARLRNARDALNGRFLRNLLLAALGVLISLVTFAGAVLLGSGGYVVAFGLVVFCGGDALNAWLRLRKVRLKLAELEERYGAAVLDTAVSAWADALLATPDGAPPQPVRAEDAI